jgi:beta-barrel assembly-enhancing protease
MPHRPIIISACTLLIALITGLPPVLADTTLPDIGQSSVLVMSPAEERRTGEAVVRNIRRAGGILEDIQVTSYINQLGYRLLAHTDNPDQHAFQFFIVNDSSINAFALPGGFIGVNYGLILASDSESELASVIAHEISHVTQRHHARAFENAGSNQIPVLAAIIAAMILGSKGNELGQAALASAAAGSIQQQINFTRHNEEEADRLGIHMLNRANLDPVAMAAFFDKLDKASRLQGSSIPDFLRTHPVNTQRIIDAQSRASQLPKPRLQDDMTYQLVRQRLLVLQSSNPDELIPRYEQDLKSQTNNRFSAATRYGYALLLLRQKKYAQAEAELTQLLKQDPHRIAYILARAEIQLNSNQVQPALRTYEAALRIYPNNDAITHDSVAALLQAQQAGRAKTVITQRLKSPPVDPTYYQYLARTEAMLSNSAESHEAMAEYYYAIGQHHQALDQLALALNTPKLDFYITSRLEARAAHIRREILPASQPEKSGQNKYQNLLID